MDGQPDSSGYWIWPGRALGEVCPAGWRRREAILYTRWVETIFGGLKRLKIIMVDRILDRFRLFGSKWAKIESLEASVTPAEQLFRVASLCIGR